MSRVIVKAEAVRKLSGAQVRCTDEDVDGVDCFGQESPTRPQRANTVTSSPKVYI